jgi:flagellar motor switch protein FliN
VTEAIEYEQFDQPGAVGSVPSADSSASGDAGADLRRLSDVPMELSVEIGRTRMTVGETLDLHAGSVITLDRLAGEPVDLLVNGTPIARGEVVVVEEQFGLRVTEILESGEAAGEAAGEQQPSVADPAADAPAGV